MNEKNTSHVLVPKSQKSWRKPGGQKSDLVKHFKMIDCKRDMGQCKVGGELRPCMHVIQKPISLV